jgi:hypothetical protein
VENQNKKPKDDKLFMTLLNLVLQKEQVKDIEKIL